MKILQNIVIFFLLLICSKSFPQDTLYKYIEDFQINENAGESIQGAPKPFVINNEIIIHWKDFRNHVIPYEMYYQRYDSSLNKIGNNFRIDEVVESMAMANLSGDTIITCWAEGDRLYLQKRNEELEPISEAVEAIGSDYSFDGNISLKTNVDNEIMLMFRAENISMPSLQLYAQKFSEDLQPIGEIIKPFRLFNSYDYDPEMGLEINSDGNYIFAGKLLERIYFQIYSDSLLLPVEKMVNDFAAGIKATDKVRLLANPDSGFAVIFNAVDNHIYYQGIKNNGELIDGYTNIDQHTPVYGKNNLGANSTTDGYKLFTWNTGRKFYAQIMNPLNEIIFEDDKLVHVNSEESWNPDPRAAALHDDNFILTFIIDGDKNEGDIAVQKMTKTGELIGEPELVNDDEGSGYQLRSDVIAINNRNYFIFEYIRTYEWRGDIYFRRSNDDGVLQDEIILNDRDDIWSTYPSIRGINSEKILAVWITPASIYGQFLNKDGQKIGENILMTNENVSYTTKPYLNTNAYGEIILAWDREQNKIRYKLFDSNLVSISESIVVNASFYGTNQSCAIDNDGAIYICWEEGYGSDSDIYLQKYSETGITDGDVIIVNDDGENIANVSPDIAVNQNTGEAAVTWRDGRLGGHNVYVQLFNHDCEPVGSNIVVNDYLNSAKDNPKIAMDERGNFVICWADNRNGSNDIYAQPFLKNGTPWKSNFLVNKDTLRNQFYPRVFIQDDILYFTWSTNHVEGKGINVWANAFEWDSVLDIKETESTDKNISFSIYPNPFNSTTTLEYYIPEQTRVKIDLFNILGEKLSTLVNETKNKGSYKLNINENSTGQLLASGVYFVVLQSPGGKIISKKIILLK
ncbi:MAG: T9SS type A sorting domain-containing protein [Melioribacteraceae bacterium]|nr:T9SS type A sorting domain-containing protein [Melioribacteraceae bacterium]MCF8357047.1 T9SS type A sorting domain-containing protein [Melioribacteraceae bacterium]MCF8396506.1 T9SS type A sorting domain-containing protein [Melioribacteraceae bacterium]